MVLKIIRTEKLSRQTELLLEAERVIRQDKVLERQKYDEDMKKMAMKDMRPEKNWQKNPWKLGKSPGNYR